MNNKLPFEDAFEKRIADIPLPPEDASWQQMSKLLDEKKRRTPLAWFNKNKLWIIIALLLFGTLWLTDTRFNYNEKNASSRSSSKPIALRKQAPFTRKKTNEKSPVSPITEQQKIATKLATGSSVNQNVAKTTASPLIENNNKKSPLTIHKTSKNATHDFSENTIKSNHKKIAISKPLAKHSTKNKGQHKTKKEENNESSSEITVSDIKSAITNLKESSIPINDSLINSEKANEFVMANNNIKKPTIVAEPPKDTLTKNTNSNTKTASKKSDATKNKFSFSAGLGIQQPIPVAGQQSIPVGYKGKSRLNDYIPSLYLRLEKDKKYFLQAEIHYAAPQLVKEFSYSRKTTVDLQSYATKTTTLRLQKTYYSEIPVSFNYYVRPNWSIGAGGIYSWFHGAIVQQDTKITNLLNQQQTLSTQLLPVNGFTDSFLYRSNTYLLLQTDYQWKRFSFGLRYSRDLQPYIKYTTPDGIILDKRNWSLDFILRFRLWKF